ncbi:MAG: hypothetical protein NVSMB47_13810 [Polyangiales bacterium]
MNVARNALVAATLLAGGLGCTTPEGPTADETRADRRPVPEAIGPIASIAAVIEVGVDRDHRAPLVVLGADVESTTTVGLAEYARDPTSEWTLVARKTLQPERLAALATIAGTRVQLHAADGTRCDALLGAPFVVGRVQADDDDEGHAPTAPRSDDAEQSVWTSTEGGRALVAPLVGGACVHRIEAGPWLAASVGTPTTFVPGQAEGPLRAQLLARFRALPEWNEVAARRREWDVDTRAAPTASWDVTDGLEPNLVVTTIDGVRHAWVSATTDGGCGDFDGRLTVAFVERAGGWTVLAASDQPAAAPTMAWKTAGGVAWTFGDGRIARPAADGTLELVATEVAFHGCGC